MNKISISDARQIAVSKGGECLSTKYPGYKVNMSWKCAFGHLFESPMQNIKRGCWCKLCVYQSLKLSSEIVIDFIENKQGMLLSKYINSKGAIEIKCREGHTWKTSFASIKMGTWCPECAKQNASKKLRLDIGFVRKTILEKCDGVLQDNEYLNQRQILSIKCNKCDSTWRGDFGHICYRGNRCPCSRTNNKYTIIDCKKFAKSMQGECLSEEYKNCKFNLLWKCNMGHEWEATFDNIRRGKWCPKCKCGKSQRVLFEIISEIFQTKVEYNFKGFNWLRNDKTGGIQEIDIWVPKFKLAIEYDGEQHFGPVDAFGGQEKFKITQLRDQTKNSKIKNHPKDVTHFVRFSYKELSKFSLPYVKERLKKEGIVW